MAYQKQTWRDYDDTKTELVNMNNGAVVTPERLNHIETGIANSADKQEVAAQLAQTENVTKGVISSPKNTQTFNKNIKPTVVFTFDDGHKEDLTVFKPILDDYGYKATTYIVSNWVGQEGFMDMNEIKQLQNSGWEIGAHSVTHQPMGAMNDSTLEREFADVKNFLLKNDLTVTNFAYPFGSYSLRANEIGVKYYESLTMFGTGHNDINTLPIRPTFLKRVALGSNFDAPNPDHYPITDTFNDYYKPLIDKAVANNGLLVFALHSKPHSTNPTQIQYFKDTLKYLSDNNINVATLKEALTLFGNSIDIEKIKSDGYNIDKYLKVSNGNIYTNMFHPTVEADFPVTNETNSDDFPKRSRTYVYARESDGFPFSGRLIHENNTDWRDLGFQTLTSHHTVGADPQIAIRRANSNGSWSRWKILQESKPSKLNNRIETTVYDNSTINVTVEDVGAKTGDGVIVTPQNNLPYGITFSAYIQSGNVVMRFHNLTGTAIELNHVFNIHLI